VFWSCVAMALEHKSRENRVLIHEVWYAVEVAGALHELSVLSFREVEGWSIRALKEREDMRAPSMSFCKSS
jgi:hypothetical protein